MTNTAARNARRAATIRQLRLDVLAALGGVCVAEGCEIADVRMLTIDHRNGGGGAHRRQRSTSVYYRLMLDQLDELQVLCANHNQLKRIEQREN